MTKQIHLTGIIPEDSAHLRLDQALAKLFPDYSRARLTQWLKQAQITVNDKIWRSKDKVKGLENIIIHAEQEEEQWEAEDIALDVVYEDDALMVINKPTGLVVHPARGNYTHTLVNALLHHCPSLTELPRAGLIHRLDKDTTGLLVIAKNLLTHNQLVKAMQERQIQRTYQAIVFGQTPKLGSIRTHMGRHPHQRLKMAVCPEHSTHGKPAITHYTTLAHYPPFSHLEVRLETGRTHQIRVHLAHMKFPIVGDPLYGISGSALTRHALIIAAFPRQALHAWKLSLIHPVTQEKMTWIAPLPQDMEDLLDVLHEI